MKARLSRVQAIVAGETAKRGLLGGGLFGAAQLGAVGALGCLLVWFLLAVVIVLLWALVAFVASVIPL